RRGRRFRGPFRQTAARGGFRYGHRAIATLLGAPAVAPLLWGGGAAAQGVLRGTVHDREGAPIRGAAVVVRGTTLATETDLQGRFRLPVVPAGAVRVHAAAIGYSFVDTTVALTGGDSTTLDIARSEERRV